MLKIQRSIMRVAERVLGLTGMPLPSEILERVQLGLEVRAIRSWEFFDEGINPWFIRVLSPAVAAEFSYARISPRASSGAKRGDLVVVTSVLTSFGGGGVAQIRVNSGGIPDATVAPVTRDTRFSSFGTIAGIDIDTGAEAAISGTQVGLTGSQLLLPETIVMNVSQATVVPTFPNLTIWHPTVNTAIEVAFEGFYIPATR